MPVPSRPVTSTVIASAWGQGVHDYTFAPSGCDVTTATTRTVNTTVGGQKCHLDVANEDPGGYLDAPNDRLEIPTNGEGLYYGHIWLDSVDGTAGDQTRVYLYINGVEGPNAIGDNDGGVHIAVILPFLEVFAAGDQIEVYAQKRGSGTNPTVYVRGFKMIRVGAEVGA
jgi:hypothetical protein